MVKNKKIYMVALVFVFAAAIIGSIQALNYMAPPREHEDNAVTDESGEMEQATEILLRGTAVEYYSSNMAGAPIYWIVHVDEVISGPELQSTDVKIIVAQAILAEWGYADPAITVGDSVEVYGAYSDDNECIVTLKTPWQTENPYYIIKK